MMPVANLTEMTPSTIILNGIPGLEEAHLWISIPFCSMYLIAMLGNCSLLYLIWIEESLHKPMYYFLCMLTLNDIAMGTCVVPQALCIFWFKLKEVDFNACLTQMFFIYTLTAMESGVLMLMALDRYVAICYPLRYATILTNSVITAAGLVTFFRSAIVVMPVVFLARRLPYCHTNVLPHTYCDHMSLVKLACASVKTDTVYGLIVTLVIGGLDIFCICFSYVMILRAVLGLSSNEARSKAFGTCTAHVCTMITTYTPAFISIITPRIGDYRVIPYIQVLMANVYLLLPAILNPVIFGVKTKQIRESFLKIFIRGKAGSEIPQDRIKSNKVCAEGEKTTKPGTRRPVPHTLMAML
ncbi:olfactory receptor 52N4-like [Alligator sinensis]|uniref:Olfactory receptor n=1 Tax=Alligator sinensis TaxID=38654 RepID=A0A1U7SHV9_ALLSI|nr:olfactory receptor 52N4-like [Alligator sinensis]